MKKSKKDLTQGWLEKAKRDLVSLAMNEEPDFEEIKTKSSVLSPYAVEVRYPEFEEPLLEDAREAVEIASIIKDFVINKLPEDL